MDTAFFDAVRSGDIGRVRALLDATPDLVRAGVPADLQPPAGAGNRALHEAGAFGQVALVQLLLERGAEIDATNAQGRTALHDAIELGQTQVAELLIRRGATVDVCAAAILGRVERLRELLDADPALANDRSTRLSPLGWASYGNQVESARELIARGARMDDGELLCAASVGHVAMGRFLLEQGADPNAHDEGFGGTALHAAACMRYTCDASEFVAMLLAAGADTSARSRSGRTALQIAEECARQQALFVAAKRERDAGQAPAGGAPAPVPAHAPEFLRNFEGVAELLRRAGADPAPGR
jgi:ankyrin repeat protein